MKPLVSILMPVKNAESYLADCLNSILDQSYQNWELIAVDDQSTDRSRSILKEYSSKDKRIQLMENQGSGIISALRTAYALSNGALIHRMDADDLMPKNKVNLLVSKSIRSGKGAVVTGKVAYFAEGGVSDGYKKYEQWLNSMVDEKNHWDQIYKECVIASPAWMIHREDLDKCGAFEMNRYPEDYDLVFRFYEKGLKVETVDEVIHEWRDHSERTSRNNEHYQANSFFALKLHYFLKLDRNNQRPLLVWGAGPKGKRLARMLKEQQIAFKWISNNPNKHGKEIYGQLMRSFKELIELENPQVIITVAQRNAKKEIVSFLEKIGLKEKEDFWFFR